MSDESNDWEEIIKNAEEWAGQSFFDLKPKIYAFPTPPTAAEIAELLDNTVPAWSTTLGASGYLTSTALPWPSSTSAPTIIESNLVPGFDEDERRRRWYSRLQPSNN